jgi:acyl-homoserine-lactone acylase
MRSLVAILFLILLPLVNFAQKFSKEEISRWQKQASQVKITRDQWGIPHIHGKTDADAVFGLLYAQCEDDFARVEMNYIEKLGRMSEVNGIKDLYDDLLIRLVLDSSEAIADYKKAPADLKKLMNAYADGINYFLHTHQAVHPVLLKRFQPWYPLLWTDGSIGAISTADISLEELKNFYSGDPSVGAAPKQKPQEQLIGSNGFAFSPSITESGNAILYINPHVTFYFRPEVHMISEEGLNVYGAVTWGQFFIYQGFNEHCGWMHTSSDADIADTYVEKITKRNNKFVYEYEGKQRPVSEKKIKLHYKDGGTIKEKTVNTFFTHHGPVMAKRNGQYLSMKATNRSMTGLIQSWQRTKSKSFNDFRTSMNLLSNPSNNTVYADAEGNIAYWHGNFMPVRDKKYDWSQPVDGSISATEWKGFHPVEETIHVYNPKNGWIQNCNSTPFTVSGDQSPKREDYPAYMAPDEENFRGINAARVLASEKKYNIDKVIKAGYNTYLSAFEVMIPPLIKSFEQNVKQGDSLFAKLHEPIEALKHWDFNSGLASVPTTLAIEWGQRLVLEINKYQQQHLPMEFVTATKEYVNTATASELLLPLNTTVNSLQQKFGKWNIAWGDINRYQRLSGDLVQKYNDDKESLPVPFASAFWGQLPSYGSRYFPEAKKRYGLGGNSFICAVEFGKKIKARSLLVGGESGDPSSPHFNDQAKMYTEGKFKEINFYPEDLQKHTEEMYHPGERK